ncbi:hypothetical protein CDD83_5293 [Cordyceps sp. RAO-2017]|nr:hypothetical protein CDD83_5293 [Cordyceps sp. RAO-2017]
MGDELRRSISELLDETEPDLDYEMERGEAYTRAPPPQPPIGSHRRTPAGTQARGRHGGGGQFDEFAAEYAANLGRPASPITRRFGLPQLPRPPMGADYYQDDGGEEGGGGSGSGGPAPMREEDVHPRKGPAAVPEAPVPRGRSLRHLLPPPRPAGSRRSDRHAGRS